MAMPPGIRTHQHSWALRYAVLALALAASILMALPGRLTLLMLLNAYALAATYARTGRSVLSPSFIFSLILTAFGVLGFIATDSLARGGQILSSLAHFGGSERNGTLSIFLLASVSTLAGAAVMRSQANARRLQLRDLTAFAPALKRSGVALWIGASTLVFNVILRPFDALLERSSYLIPTDFGGVLTYLQIPAAVTLGLALRTAAWPAKLASLAIVLLLEAFSLALSSRMMSLVVLMYFVGIALSLHRSRGLVLLAGAALALLLVPIPLHMRGMTTQGLIPNIEALGDVQFFSYDTYLTTFANFLSAFNIVALTTFSVGDIPWSAFWTSVGPLPGALLGQAPGPRLRLSSAVPYAGLGEIANQGLWLVPIFFVVVGGVFGLTEGATSRLLASGRHVYLTVAPTGVAILSAVLFAQYNLRTATRIVYVALAVAVLMRFFAARKAGEASETTDRDSTLRHARIVQRREAGRLRSSSTPGTASAGRQS